jgi:hypothetical protein
MASMLIVDSGYTPPPSTSHLRGGGGAAAEESSILTETYERRLQVIIDIDDTVKSSGGLTVGGIPIGGIDTQFQRGSLYPGVFRFILGLSRYKFEEIENQNSAAEEGEGEDSYASSSTSSSSSSRTPLEPLKVAVLTARAQEFKFALQIKESDPIAQKFANTGKQYGYNNWGIGHVMYGSVKEWIIHDHKGWRKFENFKLLRLLYPDGMEPNSYVFIGDTGELDKECGMRMLTDKHTRHIVKAIFLHVVSYDDNPIIPSDLFINGKPIVHFRTYVGAALKAVEYELMTLREAKEVIIQTCRDLSTTMMANIASHGVLDEKLGSKWKEIKRDVGIGMALYPDDLGDLDMNDLQAPPVPPKKTADAPR